MPMSIPMMLGALFIVFVAVEGHPELNIMQKEVTKQLVIALMAGTLLFGTIALSAGLVLPLLLH